MFGGRSRRVRARERAGWVCRSAGLQGGLQWVAGGFAGDVQLRLHALSSLLLFATPYMTPYWAAGIEL